MHYSAEHIVIATINTSSSFCLDFVYMAFVVVLMMMMVVLPALHQQDLPKHQCCGNLDPFSWPTPGVLHSGRFFPQGDI